MKIFAPFLLNIILLFKIDMISSNAVCFDKPFKQGIETPAGYIVCESQKQRTWSYVAEAKVCKSWNYGGCGGNMNRFGSKRECLKKCRGHVRAFYRAAFY